MTKAIKKYISIIRGILLVGIFFSVYAINTWDTGWRINANSSGGVEYEQHYCNKIINNGSADIFIPTATIAEWNSFSANMPVDVQNAGLGTGICSQNPWTCVEGTVVDTGGCGGDYATRRCVDVCNDILQVDTSCVSQDQC